MRRVMEIKLDLPAIQARVEEVIAYADALERAGKAHEQLGRKARAGAPPPIQSLAQNAGLPPALNGGPPGGQPVRERASGDLAALAAVADASGSLRFPGGPYQRLAAIPGLRAAAGALPAGPERAAKEKDLEWREFLAKRSIVLHERRMAAPEESLNRPGLLELFGDINKLFGSLISQGPGLRSSLRAIEQLLFIAAGKSVGGGSGASALSVLGGAASGRSLPSPAAMLGPAAVSTDALADTAVAGSAAASGLAAAGGAGLAAAGGAGLAALGPIGIAIIVGLVALVAEVAIGVMVFKTLFDGAKEAAKQLHELGRAALSMGGTPAQVAGLRAAGLDPQTAAGIGKGIREALTLGQTDPFKLMAGAELGLGMQISPQMGGRTNEAMLTLQAVQGLRKLSQDEQTRLARIIPALEPLLDAANVGPAAAARQRSDLALGGKVFDPASAAAARDFDAALGHIAFTFDALKTSIFSGALPVITPMLNALGDVLADLAATAAAHPELGAMLGGIVDALLLPVVGFIKTIEIAVAWLGKIQDDFTALFKSIYNDLQWVLNAVRGVLPPGARNLLPGLPDLPKDLGKTDPHTQALNANTRAINDWTAYVQREVGGGPRARGAIPTAMRDLALRQRLESDTLSMGGLGAFAL